MLASRLAVFQLFSAAGGALDDRHTRTVGHGTQSAPTVNRWTRSAPAHGRARNDESSRVRGAPQGRTHQAHRRCPKRSGEPPSSSIRATRAGGVDPFRRDPLPLGARSRWIPSARRGLAERGLAHPSFRGYAVYMASDQFRPALQRVLADAAQHRVAIMCAETLWYRCHRRLIADAAAVLCGATVLHLGHDGQLSPHRLTEGFRCVQGDALVYDAGSPLHQTVLTSGPHPAPSPEGSRLG